MTNEQEAKEIVDQCFNDTLWKSNYVDSTWRDLLVKRMFYLAKDKGKYVIQECLFQIDERLKEDYKKAGELI